VGLRRSRSRWPGGRRTTPGTWRYLMGRPAAGPAAEPQVCGRVCCSALARLACWWPPQGLDRGGWCAFPGGPGHELSDHRCRWREGAGCAVLVVLLTFYGAMAIASGARFGWPSPGLHRAPGSRPSAPHHDSSRYPADCRGWRDNIPQFAAKIGLNYLPSHWWLSFDSIPGHVPIATTRTVTRLFSFSPPPSYIVNFFGSFGPGAKVILGPTSPAKSPPASAWPRHVPDHVSESGGGGGVNRSHNFGGFRARRTTCLRT